MHAFQCLAYFLCFIHAGSYDQDVVSSTIKMGLLTSMNIIKISFHTDDSSFHQTDNVDHHMQHTVYREKKSIVGLFHPMSEYHARLERVQWDTLCEEVLLWESLLDNYPPGCKGGTMESCQMPVVNSHCRGL